jgi:hypothetical protein
MPPIYRPRLWHLVAIGLIAIFDLGVLYMVLNPRVSDDYRAYYITRTASCFPRLISGFYPLGEPLSFVPGSHNGYDLDTTRWCGFLPPSSTGIRSFGDYGILKLKFPDPGEDLLLTFTSWVNSGADKPARPVEVLVNGDRVGTLNFTSFARIDGKIIIPASVVAAGKGEMEIRFNVPRTGPPGTNGEPVTLQLRMESLRLVALSEAPPGMIGAKKAGSPPPSPRSRRAG